MFHVEKKIAFQFFLVDHLKFLNKHMDKVEQQLNFKQSSERETKKLGSKLFE